MFVMNLPYVYAGSFSWSLLKASEHVSYGSPEERPQCQGETAARGTAATAGAGLLPTWGEVVKPMVGKV